MENSPKSQPVSPEIQRLVHRSFDGPISADELSQIQAALSSSPKAQQWYCEVAQLHADLASTKQSLNLCRQVQIECGDSSVLEEFRAPQGTRRLVQRVAESIQRFPFGIAASLLAVGIGLGCGVGLFAATLVHVAPRFVPLPWNWSVGQDVVAKVESTHNVLWQPSESPETLPTQGLRVGQQIRIEEGLMQLAFRDGVSLILTGPAVFEVKSANGGKLYEGKLSAVSSENAAGFNVETAAGRFQFGPGHYGVEVLDLEAGELGTETQTNVHAFSGIANGVVTAYFASAWGETVPLTSGESLRFVRSGPPLYTSLPSSADFPRDMPAPQRERFTGSKILLANLFDDSKTASLTEAMESDAYQAAGETIDLGVAAVRDGGLDVDVSLAEDGVVFNFANVGGGGPAVLGLPSNDTFRSVTRVPIRTTGEDFGGPSPLAKIEEGIGICANELITFDLNELRRAGNLGDVPMRFVVDRAGINDREDPLLESRDMARVNVVTVVSTADGVEVAYVNDRPLPVTKVGGVFSVDLNSAKLPRSLRYDGQFVSLDVPVTAEARFLSVAVTMVGVEHHDHAVLSGARLELVE